MRIEHKLLIPVSILTIGNIIQGYVINKLVNQEAWEYLLTSILPFVVAFIFLLIPKKENPKVMSIILLIWSCIGVFFGDYTDLVSITLFVFSLFIREPSKKVFTAYIIIISICMMLRFSTLDMTPFQIGIFLGGSSCIFIFYMHYIHPCKRVNMKKNYDLSTISQDVIDIIALRIQGYDYPEINQKLELNIYDNQVSRKINIAMKKHGFKTREEFIFHLSKMEIIKTIIDNENTYNK